MSKKSRRQRERSKVVRGSATDRAEKQRGGVRPYLNLPKKTKMFNFTKGGTKRIDVIEYITKNNPETKKGSRFFARTFFIHKGIGPDGESHLCPKKTFGKPCPVCKHRAKLSSTRRDSDDDDDEKDDLKPKERQLFAVVDPKHKKDGVQILDMSYHLFGKELDSAIKLAKKKHGKEQADKFASPDEGLSVKCEVEEKKYKKATYTNIKLAKLVEREEQYDEELLEEVPCLDDLLVETPYEELKELFDQSGDDEDDDDDSDDDADDEEESDDDDDDDDGDDEDADEEEDDDSDDDEESDDDNDDEEDDDEDEDEIAKGDRVKFTYKGKKLKGKVLRIKNDLAHVKTKDRSDPYAVDPADCSKI